MHALGQILPVFSSSSCIKVLQKYDNTEHVQAWEFEAKQLNLGNTAACLKILSKFNLQSVMYKVWPHHRFYFAFSVSALQLRTNKF